MCVHILSRISKVPVRAWRGGILGNKLRLYYNMLGKFTAVYASVPRYGMILKILEEYSFSTAEGVTAMVTMGHSPCHSHAGHEQLADTHGYFRSSL